MRVVRTTLMVVLVAISLLVLSSPADASGSCDTGAAGETTGITVYGTCFQTETESGDPTTGETQQPVKTIICGFPSSNTNAFWDSRCLQLKDCPKGPAFGTFIQQNGTWVWQQTWCAGQAQPVQQLTAADLRDQVLRLLPTVQIGSAWTTRALVNAQTILWAETDPNRSLGTVTVVGRQVALRIRFDHATWDFGDGATDTTTDPGRVYSDADPCTTAQCPAYYGHTYTDTGPVAITLTVAWHAQFSLDNGTTWTDVDPAPLTGPAATHDLTAVQARGILVPDPGH